MPDTIIFDYGGVLGSNANNWTEYPEVLIKTGLSKQEIDRIFYQLWPELKIGKVDLELFFERINKISKKNIDIEKLRNIYHKNIFINENLLDISKSLKQNYNLYILSNESVEGMAFKTNKFNLNKYFLKIFNSADLKISKPDSKIYETVLHEINSTPDQIIFIDDQEKNLLSAQKLGINTILYENLDSLKVKLALLNIAGH